MFKNAMPHFSIITPDFFLYITAYFDNQFARNKNFQMLNLNSVTSIPVETLFLIVKIS